MHSPSGPHSSHSRRACLGTPGFDEALLEARVARALERQPPFADEQRMRRVMDPQLCAQQPPTFSSQLEFSIKSGGAQLQLSHGLPRICALDDWVGATVHIGMGLDAERCTVASVDASGKKLLVTREFERPHAGRLDARAARPQHQRHWKACGAVIRTGLS